MTEDHEKDAIPYLIEQSQNRLKIDKPKDDRGFVRQVISDLWDKRVYYASLGVFMVILLIAIETVFVISDSLINHSDSVGSSRMIEEIIDLRNRVDALERRP